MLDSDSDGVLVTMITHHLETRTSTCSTSRTPHLLEAFSISHPRAARMQKTGGCHVRRKVLDANPWDHIEPDTRMTSLKDGTVVFYQCFWRGTYKRLVSHARASCY